jgi:hypothetical protein
MDRGSGPMAAGPARGPPNMLLAADKQTLLSWVLSAACVWERLCKRQYLRHVASLLTSQA